MTVDILLYQLRMAAVHCRPQPPRIFAIDSQRCVDIWLVGHSSGDPFFSEVLLDFSHVVLIGKIPQCTRRSHVFFPQGHVC